MTGPILLAVLCFSVAAVLVVAFIGTARNKGDRKPPSWNKPDQDGDG